MKPYAITITPADIVIYTGGTGYSGVLDDAGDFVGSMDRACRSRVITSICPTLWKRGSPAMAWT